MTGQESREGVEEGLFAEWHLLGMGLSLSPTTRAAVELEKTPQSYLKREPGATSLHLHRIITQGPTMQKTQVCILCQVRGQVLAMGTLATARLSPSSWGLRVTHFSIPPRP